MSFQGPDPYGTPGGFDSFSRPQSPPDIRMAEGRVYYFFLNVNGAVTEINRENVEDVIRVLGLHADDLLGMILRDDGAVIDANARDLDFIVFFTVNQTGVGIVSDTLDPAAFDEEIRDVIAAALVAGNGITIAVSDPFDTITPALNFAGSGAANTVARSDHKHTATAITTQNSGFIGGAGVLQVDATCPAGTQVVGGGWSYTNVPQLVIWSLISGNAWSVRISCAAGGVPGTLSVNAFCEETPVL
jgi:hypothetical protein